MLETDRTTLRTAFFTTWRKLQAGNVLTALEAQLASIIAQHPQYHAVLADPERNLTREMWPEFGATNPFLHMALHQALREQVNTDRPTGIAALYRHCTRARAAIDVEHQMLPVLTHALEQARHGAPVSDAAYLTALQQRLSTEDD